MFGSRRGYRGGGGYGGGGGYYRQNRTGMALMLLFMQMAQVGFNHIPPVTLTTIAAQVAIFLKVIKIPGMKFPSLNDVCISTINVYYRKDYRRLFTAAFFHGDEWHLYYNMVSFLWKAISLEKKWGSGYMLYLLSVFTILCNAVTVGLGLVAEEVFSDPTYLSQCAVGFSGVLFALKVVTTQMLPPGTTYVMGFFPVNSRWACWVELLAIQMMVPNASFLGHLAGILVGMAYTKGPLKSIMDVVVPHPPSYTYHAGTTSSSSRPRGRTVGTGGSWWNPFGTLWSPNPRRMPGSGNPRFTGTGYAGGASTGSWYDTGASSGRGTDYSAGTNNSPGTEYSAGLTEDEQLQEAMRRSMNDHHDTSMRERAAPSAPPADPPPYTDTEYPSSQQAHYPSQPPPPYPGSNHATTPPPFQVPSGAPTLPTGSSKSTRSTRSSTAAASDTNRLYPDLDSTNSAPPAYGWNLDQDEVRRRRLARFES